MKLDKNHIKYITLTLILIIGAVLIYLYIKRKKQVVKPSRHIGKANTDLITSSNPVNPVISNQTTETETKTTSSDYVGPQDCAENCNRPYDNYILLCYKKNTMPGVQLDDCLKSAELMKQDCLGKCSETLPRYKDLTQDIATPIQEANYFSNLFRQGYV